MLIPLTSILLCGAAFCILRVSSPTGSFPRPLTAAQEAEYISAMLQGDQKARQKLIEHNLRLVAHIVKKYYAANADSDDLISIGTIGLIKGVSSFDPSKNVRLATYISRCIENPILSQMRLCMVMHLAGMYFLKHLERLHAAIAFSVFRDSSIPEFDVLLHLHEFPRHVSPVHAVFLLFSVDVRLHEWEYSSCPCRSPPHFDIGFYAVVRRSNISPKYF